MTDRRTWLKTILAAPLAAAARGQTPAGRLEAVPLAEVAIEDAFWTPWLDRDRKITLPHVLRMAEETGVVANFLRAAGKLDGDYQGYEYNDSVLYEAIAAAAELGRPVDDLVEKIAAAQEPDGYLWTRGTIRQRQTPGTRQLLLPGHLYDAAVAHFRATGKRTLLDVALKNFALIEAAVGPGKPVSIEANGEQGLARLYEATGEKRCLRLAHRLLDARGRAQGEPITNRNEIAGPARAAAYLAGGVAAVGLLEGDEPYATAAGRLWDDTANAKMYLTGGIGSEADSEAFGPAYSLPNRTASSDTCAALAFARWSYWMFLLDGDGRHIDVLERTLYNNLLASVSLQGDSFFYTNPLESDGQYAFNRGRSEEEGAGTPYGEPSAARKKWFYRACCPPNSARALPEVASWMYATRGTDLYVNLFASGEAKVKTAAGVVRVRQETRYPWDGNVRITLEPERPGQFRVYVRVPGWAQGRPVPSNLYSYLQPKAQPPSVKVNAREFPAQFDKGYAMAERRWGKGDRIELELAMPIRRVIAHPRVQDDARRVALERGPIVYCVEGADNNGRVLSLMLPDGTDTRAQHRRDLLGGVTVIEGDAAENNQVRRFTAIPYYAWANRGAGEMAVWMRRAM